MLNQIQSPITSVTADSTYDAKPVYRTIAARQPQLPPIVIIPLRATAVPSSVVDTTPSLRDWHIQVIQEKGRLGGQKALGYGKRALGETAMFRYNTIDGPRLRAHPLPAQKSEARLACAVINRMTQLGMPLSQQVRSRNSANPPFVPPWVYAPTPLSSCLAALAKNLLSPSIGCSRPGR